MKVNIEITESSDWKSKKVLKVTPLDVESAFEVGRLFESLYTSNKVCTARLTNNGSIILPLMERDELNMVVIAKNVDDDEPPF